MAWRELPSRLKSQKTRAEGIPYESAHETVGITWGDDRRLTPCRITPYGH